MSLLAVSNLTKEYGKNKAVNSISFHIEEGRCVALLGPNGAGKTTTLKMLSGLLTPTRGEIEFLGTSRKDIRKSIGFLPQYPSFFNWMTGKEFLEFVGQLAHLSRKESSKRANDLLELMGLADTRNRRIGGYSGGMKQRLGLAQAMIHQPKLIILDEPVSALDPIGRREVLELMRTLKKETTILFSTHVLHDAEEISDDILIIRKGEIAIKGEMKEIKQQYQQPVITIRTAEPMNAWVKSLTTKPYVSEVEVQQEKIKIIVNNIENAKLSLLREIVDQQISISQFEVGRTTLEDLFMKVVQE